MSRRPSPATHRIVPIKRADGEPLTRTDIQYDVLHNIFSDTHKVFTNPYPVLPGEELSSKLTFRELYIKALLNSEKATKSLRDKLGESILFTEDFAMLALLVNVGRINTTMSFFPEMKTAIRTYHPIPALQRTNGNLQDAPRIKHILKASLLEKEVELTPSNPADVLAEQKVGSVPSTSVMNLVFVLANHSAPVGQAHFQHGLDFVDLFLRTDVSSPSRARAFLWLCYHYLESSSTEADDDYDMDVPVNPFSDPSRGKTPNFVFLTAEETAQENIDPEEEKALASRLVTQRNRIVAQQGGAKQGTSSAAPSVKGDDDEVSVANPEDPKGKGKRGTLSKKPSTAAKERKAIADKLRRQRIKEEAKERERLRALAGRSDEDRDNVNESVSASILPLQNQYPKHQPKTSSSRVRRMASTSPNPSNSHPSRYAPYKLSSTSRYPTSNVPRSQRPVHIPRTMLQHAWHVITTSDPLLDSDDELGDEYVREDYLQRLQIISRMRGKPPTPEPQQLPASTEADSRQLPPPVR